LRDNAPDDGAGCCLFGAFTGFERALASPDADTRVSSPVRPVPQRQAPGRVLDPDEIVADRDADRR
jgi:hypothetical protein